MAQRYPGDSVAVGKRFGVAPVLARRTPAAGRNARKVVQTGIIGKASAPKMTPAIAELRRKLAGAEPQGEMTRRLAAAKAKPVSKNVLSEVAAGLKTGLRGASGPGSSAAEASAIKFGAGANAGAQKVGGLVAAKPVQSVAVAGAGGIALGRASKKPVSKRRFDPEDERRHRQGLEAGALGTGGVAAAGYGGRGVVRDTKALRADHGGKGLARVLHPGPAPVRFNSVTRGGTADRKAQEKIGNLQAYDAEMNQYARRLDATNKLKRVKTPGGALIRGRNAALVGGGLGAVGLAAAHHGQRRESRWD